MSYLLLSSEKDPAGMNIYKALKENYPFELINENFDGKPVYATRDITLATTANELPYVEDLDRNFANDVYIFLSKHRSESGIPTLTAHFPGNLTPDSSHGGKPREVAYTFPSLLKEYMKRLWEARHRVANYEITLEPTHHGPTSLTKPVLFVELGSLEPQWLDKDAASVIAHGVMETLEAIRSSWGRKAEVEVEAAIGIGGTHYAKKFTEYLLEGGLPLAGIFPKYALPFLDVVILSQMARKSKERVTRAVLDWKGLGKEKESVLRVLEEVGLEVVKI